jgi:hypothetical protein
MRLHSWLFFNLICFLVAIAIIFSTVSFRLGQVDIYEKVIDQGNFINKFHSLFLGEPIKNIPNDKVLTFLHFDILSQKIGDKETIEKLIKINTQLFVENLNTPNEIWQIYLPLTQANSILKESINEKIVDYISKNPTGINICSSAQEKTLKNKGISINNDFCLPKSVRDGETTWLRFLGRDSNNYLSNVYSNSILVTDSEKVPVSSISNLDRIDKIIIRVKIFKNFFITNYLIIYLMLFAVIILFYLFHIKNIDVLFLLKNGLIAIGLYGIGILTIFLVFLVTTPYLKNIIVSSINSEFSTTYLVSLLVSLIFSIFLELLLPLYWYFFGMSLFAAIILILERSRILETTNTKNSKLVKKKFYRDFTLDSSFQVALKQENMLRSFGSQTLLKQDKHKSVIFELNGLTNKEGFNKNNDKVIESFKKVESSKLQNPISKNRMPGL